jgi:hypothetical protein
MPAAYAGSEGDPLQVATWYQTCFDAGLPVIVQVNEEPGLIATTQGTGA